MFLGWKILLTVVAANVLITPVIVFLGKPILTHAVKLADLDLFRKIKLNEKR